MTDYPAPLGFIMINIAVDQMDQDTQQNAQMLEKQMLPVLRFKHLLATDSTSPARVS